jgi:hypothetical protein
MHRTGTTQSRTTSKLGADQAQAFTQDIKQRFIVPLLRHVHPLIVDTQFHEGSSVSESACHFIQDAPRGIE